MSIIDSKRAESIARVLPQCVKDEIKEQQPIWKKELLEKLPIALSGNDYRAIRLWLADLDLYNSSEVFTFTKSEVEQILQILFDFIVSMRFLQYSITAINIFNDIIESIYEPLDICFDWRKIYNVIYTLSISHTKIKKRSTPNNYIPSIVTFAVSCNKYFKPDTTEQLLSEWKTLIDPQTPLITISSSLVCLFMPVNHNKHSLWFDYLIDVWSLFPSVIYNSIFLPLYVRLSAQYIPDFDWSPYIPFFFQKLSLFIGVPISPIDQETDSRASFSVGSSEFMFVEPMSANDLSCQFSILIVRLLSTSAKEVVKDHLYRLIHLLEPLHSPIPETSNPNTIAQAIIFLNALVASYSQRVKADRRKKLPIPALTPEDHLWFVNLILPSYILELYHDDSSCEQLGQLVQLAPECVIPPVYEAFMRLSEYAHLKAPALRAISAIAPTILVTGIQQSDFLNVFIDFADDITAMDIEKSQWIFTLFEAVLWSKRMDDTMSSWALTIVRRCIEFATTAVSDDFNDSLDSMELLLSALSVSIDSNLRETIDGIIEENIEVLPIQNISRFVDSFTPECLCKRCFNEVTERNLVIMKCLVRSSKTFTYRHEEEIQKMIFDGLNNPLKKVRHESCVLLKWILSFHSLVFCFFPERQGVCEVTEDSVEWHIPTPEDYSMTCQIVDKCIPIMDEMFSKKADKKSMKTAVEMAYYLLKGIIGAVSPTHFKKKEVPPLFDSPSFHFKTSVDLSKRLEKVTDWLLSITEMNLHEDISASILKCYGIIITTVDPIALRADSISERFDLVCGSTKQSILLPSAKAMFPNHHYWLALKLYSKLAQLVDLSFNELISKVVLKIFIYAASPLPEVRKQCESVMAQASIFYGNEIADLFPRMMDVFKDCFLLSDDSLATISIFMSDFIQVANPSTQFNLIGQIAITLCRQLPTEIPNDNLRELRNQIIKIIDSFDFSMPPLDSDELFEERKNIIYSSICRSDLYASSAETQNYAVALVCSVLIGKKPVLESDVFEFLSSMFVSDDLSVRNVSLQVFGCALEMLIPRVKYENRIEYPELTELNYDTFQFTDTKVKLIKKKSSRPLTKEESFDEKVVQQYFPDDYENRVEINKTLYKVFFDDNSSFVYKFCCLFANSQVHDEECFSLEKYSFWVSLVRFFGPPMMLKLIEIATEFLNKEPQLAYLFTASEMVAAVICATIYFKFNDFKIIFDPLFKFLRQAMCGPESDTSFSWFIVLFGVLSDSDPRRYFWLFDFLRGLHPEHDVQVKSKYIRQDTEICLILFFSSVRDIRLMDSILSSRLPIYFDPETLETTRSSVVQILLSLARACCRFPSSLEWINLMKNVFNQYILKTDAKFFARWISEQFLQINFGSLVVAPFCIDKLRDFVMIEISNDDDTMSLLNAGIVGLLRTNLFFGCPSKEMVNEKIKEIIEKLNPSNLPWTKQVLMISLFIELTKEMFYYISPEIVDYIIHDVALPALEHPNADVQDTASVLLSFLLRTFVNKREQVPQFVETFTQKLNNGENRLGAAKGLFAVIWSTTIFDDVPQYIIDSFSALTSKYWNDSVLEDQINQFLGEFKNTHEDNFTEKARQLLSPFTSNIMPSYIS